MVWTLQDLKVDQTFLQSDQIGIFITNINVPEHEFINLNNILERIRLLILSDYINVTNVQYQVCASYELRNSETGDVRQWTGSFNPTANESSALSIFQTFGPNFKSAALNACSPDNIYRKLQLYHVQTKWVFHKLNSIIICVQAGVSPNHPTLLRRSLVRRRHGRSRAVCTFLLP
jgi:hypothetical protein